MGYFSNGTEGMIYEETFCARCLNYGNPDEGQGCPIWDSHLLYAYEECNSESNAKAMLDMFIPREEPGLNGNGRCRMFLQDPDKEPLPAWTLEHVL
jgi:hypothetical protein